jgi:TRAP-type C4-dicarboxylate transport system permease small subunit
MSKLDKPSKYLGYLGAAVLFLMMLLTTVDVASRYLFNSPILGALEITEFMVVTVVFGFLGLTQQEKGHVAVDLVLGNLPSRPRRLVDFINRMAGLVILVLITWKTLERALELMHMDEYSGTLHIPVAPFVFLVALGCGAMCLELVRQMFAPDREEK